MRKLTITTGLIAAVGVTLLGLAYCVVVTLAPNPINPSRPSETRSTPTADASTITGVIKLTPEETIEQPPPPNPHVVGEPVELVADGRSIEMPYRGMFPFVGDLDGDGRDDLLLGTPESGRLKVFPGLGGNDKQTCVLGKPTWFDDKVPDGWIPKG